MVTSISPYVPIRVVRTHPFAKVAFQGAGTKEKLKNKLYVLLPRLSSESEPVITSLDNYIALRRK